MGSVFPTERSSMCLFILTPRSLHPHCSKWQYYSLVQFEMETIICLGITRRALYYKEKKAYSSYQDPVVTFSPQYKFSVIKMMNRLSKWMLCVG